MRARLKKDPLTGAPKFLSPDDTLAERKAIASYGLATCVDPTPSPKPTATPTS